jgi:hypothetical protein
MKEELPATCKTHGHLFARDKKCIFCGKSKAEEQQEMAERILGDEDIFHD